MAFTFDTVLAQIDSTVGAGTTTGRTIQIDRCIDNGNGSTDLYCIGVSTPYSNKPPQWVTVANSQTAAQAATAILAVFKS